MYCDDPTIPLPMPLPTGRPGLTPLPGPTLRPRVTVLRLLGPADVTGGRRVAAMPAGRVRAVGAVDVELILPVLPLLTVRPVVVASAEVGLGTVRVDDGFRVVVGTKLDDGFRCD